jgi:hypothetical protein
MSCVATPPSRRGFATPTIGVSRSARSSEENVNPTIGRIVIYTLTEDDSEDINLRRQHFTAFNEKHRTSPGGHEIQFGETGKTGHMAHVGTIVFPGDEYPAMITRVYSDGGINLKVELDGTDNFWVPDACNWSWPERI